VDDRSKSTDIVQETPKKEGWNHSEEGEKDDMKKLKSLILQKKDSMEGERKMEGMDLFSEYN
jgi:hypothetical protein